MKKNTLITLIVLVIFSLSLTACQPAESTDVPSGPEATPASGNEASAGEPMEVVLDPSMGINTDAAAYVYETLTAVEDGQAVLVLVAQVTVSDDGLDYILQLLPGVSFHDGTSLNADAIIANFDRWFDAANGVEAWAAKFGGFKGEVDDEGKSKSIYDGIEKVDELTVLIHLNEPDAEFLSKLADPAFAIISPDALAAPNFGSASGVDGGTGPYMIGAWTDTGVTLEPFADYWNPNEIPESSMDITLGN